MNVILNNIFWWKSNFTILLQAAISRNANRPCNCGDYSRVGLLSVSLIQINYLSNIPSHVLNPPFTVWVKGELQTLFWISDLWSQTVIPSVPRDEKSITVYFPSTLCLTSVTQVLITIICYSEKRPRVKAEILLKNLAVIVVQYY